MAMTPRPQTALACAIFFPAALAGCHWQRRKACKSQWWSSTARSAVEGRTFQGHLRAAAADIAGTKRGQCCSEHLFAQHGIRIEPHEPGSGRSGCRGIARTRNLTMRFVHHARSRGKGDRSGAIGRIVVADQNFIGRQSADPGGPMDRFDRAADE